MIMRRVELSEASQPGQGDIYFFRQPYLNQFIVLDKRIMQLLIYTPVTGLARVVSIFNAQSGSFVIWNLCKIRPHAVPCRRVPSPADSGYQAQRTPPELPARLPLSLKSAQHVHLSAGKYEEAQNQKVLMICWLIKGRAMVAVGPRRMPWTAGDMAIFHPSQPIRFWTLTSDNEFCIVSADGPLAEDFSALHLGLRAGVSKAGPPPVQQIYRMIESLKDQTPRRPV